MRWVVKEWKNRTGEVFRYPDRGILSLAQGGFLNKVSKGIYWYDPKYAHQRKLEDFTVSQRKEILERDGYKCDIGGRGKSEGVELHVDHIKPKDFGERSNYRKWLDSMCTTQFYEIRSRW